MVLNAAESGKGMRISEVDLLLAGLLTLYAISYFRHGALWQGFFLFPATYVVLYLACRLFFSIAGRNVSVYSVFYLLCAACCFESIFGVAQIMGIVESRHALFPMTGTFDNPGPYGGFISIGASASLAAILHNKAGRACKIVSALTLSLCLIVLPATMSRTAWIAFVAAAALCCLNIRDVRSFISSRKMGTALVSLAILCAAALLFFLKKDSAIGRLHIWNMDLRVIAANPLFGAGPNEAMGAYAAAQASYFSSSSPSAGILMVAGCPEFAFNEFLRVGMETGIPGLAAAASLPCRAKSLCIASGLIPVIATIALITVISTILAPKCRERARCLNDWKSETALLKAVEYDSGLDVYENLFPAVSDRFRIVYDYAYALHKQGGYEKSNSILEMGAKISSDPLFHVIMGKNYEALSRFDEAEDEYRTAIAILPCRLYARSLLMKLKLSRSEDAEAEAVAREIASAPVNERMGTMVDLQSEAKHILDSLCRK